MAVVGVATKQPGKNKNSRLAISKFTTLVINNTEFQFEKFVTPDRIVLAIFASKSTLEPGEVL